MSPRARTGALLPPGVGLIPESFRALDEVDGHNAILVVGIFSDERPLQGLAALCDWRLKGRMSALLMQRRLFSGAWGERLLMPTSGLLPAPRLLALGLGAQASHRRDRALAAATELAQTATGLGATAIISDTLGLDRLPGPLARAAPALAGPILAPETMTRWVAVTADGAWPGTPRV